MDGLLITASTSADITVSGLTGDQEITILTYLGNGISANNCNDLAGDFLSSITINSDGTIVQGISCLDETHTSVNGGHVVSCASELVTFERRWIAVDACGNESVLVQEVTIVDTEGPTITGVPDHACQDTTLPDDVRAVDNCLGEEVPVSLTETLEDTPCGEVLVRIWSAVDACGNESTAEQRVVFEDNTDPELIFNHPLLFNLMDGATLELPISFELGDPDNPIDFGAEAVLATDECVGDLEVVLEYLRIADGDCKEDGYLTIDQYTWTTTDPCGNVGEITIFVQYVDDLAPEVLNWPEDVTIYCDQELPAIPDLIVQDDAGELETSFDETAENTDFGQVINRIWILTDACGNRTEVQQRIYLYENDLECSFEDFGLVSCNSSARAKRNRDWRNRSV